MITALLLAAASPGPYDTLCAASAEATAAAIVAREAGVPLAKAMTVLDDPVLNSDEGQIAQRIMRAAILRIYSEPRHGGPTTKADETEFISQSTATCILRLEREAAAESQIPTGTPLRNLTGVKP